MVLREIAQEDALEIFKNFSDPEITKWFFEEPYTQLTQVYEIIAKFNRDFLEMKGLTWGIILRENGEFIGTCGYDNLEISHHGEIGFDLSKEYWGKGFMTEALSAIIDYGFEILDFARIEADIFSNNLRAMRVLEKLSFQLDRVTNDLSYFSLSREAGQKIHPKGVQSRDGLTSRRRRPGMRRDLLCLLYDGGAGIAGGGENPGTSAQSRGAARALIRHCEVRKPGHT